jgi:hypothetical protein
MRSSQDHGGSSRRALIRPALAVVLLALAATKGAFAAESMQNVRGLSIYLGVMPAEIVQGHAREHDESKMHRGVPSDRRRQRHVVVAVFDQASGVRIEDAVVTAKVAELGLAPVEKRLEPMPIAGAMSYGNFFAMSAPGTYRIDVRVSQPATSTTAEARFTYGVPR